MGLKKTSLKKITERIRQQQEASPKLILHKDSEGDLWQGRPYQQGSRQLSAGEVKTILADPEVIVLIIPETS